MMVKFRPYLWPLLFSLVYFPLSCTLATWKRLWSDEVFTYHLSRLPNLTSLWGALREGPDATGPLHFLSVRLAYIFLGETPLATRLPAVVGVWVMALAFYAFLARRMPALVAATILVFPLSTELYLYVIEGRSYGLYLAFTGLAFLCWQSAAEGAGRRLALVGLGMSLALAVASQYNAVLIFIPLVTGELVRSWSRRRVDVPVWLAIISGLIPLPLCAPFIKNAATFSVYTRGLISLRMIVDFYDWLLKDTIPPLIGAVLLVPVALSLAWSRRRAEQEPAGPPLPLHEVVAAAGLAALPVFMVVAAKLVTGVTQYRYCLPAAAGFGILIAVLIARLRDRVTAGAVFSTIFLGWFVLGFAARAALSNAYSGQETRDNPFRVPAGGPEGVATCDYHMYVTSHYYMSPVDASNLCYITGLKDCLTECEIKKLRPWISKDKPLRVRDYGDFVSQHHRFLVYGNPLDMDSIGMLIERLKADGAKVDLVETRVVKFGGGTGEFQLFQVSGAGSNERRPPGSPVQDTAAVGTGGD